MRPLRLWLTLLALLLGLTISAQQVSLVGTRWNIAVSGSSDRPYDFIFGSAGSGNVLYPNGELADFVWSEDLRGRWTATVTRMVRGVKKVERFSGQITAQKGTGFYTHMTDKTPARPFVMHRS